MIDTASKLAIERLCAGVDEHVLQDFFTRMDASYFTTFSPEEIANHIRLSTSLNRNNPVQFEISQEPSQGSNAFEIVIVGFDYLAEFSVFCGLLSAYGLDIHSGDIYSFAPAVSSRTQSQRKIVDVFSVRATSPEMFGDAKQQEFGRELQTFSMLLAAGSTNEARERLNRFVVERIEAMNEELEGLLAPIKIDFRNDISDAWTVMHSQAADTFGFLYALSNALSMRGIYIHKVKIRSSGKQATDEFFIADRWGHKIEDEREQSRLRTIVGMITQFTHFLPRAADPSKAIRHFDQFLDKIAEEEFPDHTIAFLARPEGMTLLAQLLGSSDFLWDDFLKTHFRELFPVLENFLQKDLMQKEPSLKASLERDLRMLLDGASTFEEQKKALNRFKDRHVFLIDVRHLVDPALTLIDFSLALTNLAEVIVGEAARLCHAHWASQHKATPGSFTICGLGKFGGREMGYASDLELLFVHESPEATPLFESVAREVFNFIETREKGIFQIDLRLRPYGNNGAWSTSFGQFANYYSADGEAAPFERQALIKLRWVAGDESLGRRVEAHRDTFTYSGATWDWTNAMHLRRRQMRELVKPGQFNAKLSPGGIVDIEYAVQYLQILHGKDHPQLRVTNTLDAIESLKATGIIGESEYEVWRKGYLFLRSIIDALRIVRGDARDLILPARTSDEYKALARRLGYDDPDRSKNAESLAHDIERWTTDIHNQFTKRFGKGI